MPDAGTSHWLFRLSAAEWMAAAENELRSGEQAIARRAVRPAVTHARRGAGMALNAVLLADDAKAARYGRSYMDHLVALAGDATAPGEARAAAQRLLGTPARPPTLVKIGTPDATCIADAATIIAYARAGAGSSAVIR